ncbi:MAG: hypothetical protein CVU90_13850 [Firmicutes bacterium HGW-Firmicutes-15]|nr:MAG: hypothetical protein CVU90_13850 [Firmicutes bacterium HGW-Firmicutes-15]
MAKKVKMNSKQFGLWIEEKAGAKFRLGPGRTDCVVNIDHIEPGKFASLYAIDSATGLVVVELVDSFANEDEAWQAIEDASSPAHPPRFYTEWMGEQYLTDKTAHVERFKL